MQEIANISLHKLSVTRWSARIEAVKPLVNRPRELLEALGRLEEHDLPGDLCNDVDSLSKWLKSFEFYWQPFGLRYCKQSMMLVYCFKVLILQLMKS